MLQLRERPGESRLITDPAIPMLPAVLDPVALGVRLRERLPAHAQGLEGLRVRPLRYHAGKRCVVDVTWRRGEHAFGLIGKVYAKDRSDVYRVMKAICRAGFGPHAEYSIPEPTAYLEALHLLLQEKVEGRPATDAFLSDDESERADAAERCGHWLARFHAIAPQIGPRVDTHSHLASMAQWVRRLASLGGPFAAKAGTLFERLEATASEPGPTALRTIHGDYTHHQVILAPGRTVTVDWDKCRLAEPSHDVARFVVGLERLALKRLGSVRALDGPAEVFLAAYGVSARSDPTTRLAFHMAAICLEHAKHDVHKQAPGWPDKALATLDEGLRVLAQGS